MDGVQQRKNLLSRLMVSNKEEIYLVNGWCQAKKIVIQYMDGVKEIGPRDLS